MRESDGDQGAAVAAEDRRVRMRALVRIANGSDKAEFLREHGPEVLRLARAALAPRLEADVQRRERNTGPIRAWVLRRLIMPVTLRAAQHAVLGIVVWSPELNDALRSGRAARARWRALSHPGTLQTLHRIDAVYGYASMPLPPRIAIEQLGDAMEHLTQRQQCGMPTWSLYVAAVAYLIWAYVNAFRALFCRE